MVLHLELKNNELILFVESVRDSWQRHLHSLDVTTIITIIIFPYLRVNWQQMTVGGMVTWHIIQKFY